MADASRGRGRILALLKIQDGISTKDLSYLLGIRVASLNELLAKLEKADYITREPSPEDRRISLIKLTAAGRAAAAEVPADDSPLAALTAEEQANLDSYLDKMIAVLEEKMGEEVDERARWAEDVRERIGEDRFAQWAAAVGEQLGDEQMLEKLRHARGKMHDKHRKHGKNGKGGKKHGRRGPGFFEEMGSINPEEFGPQPPFPPPGPTFRPGPQRFPLYQPEDGQ
ncbi:MAG: MarR family transcriptional regulator [Propionibacteriaceae bacterium]|jgi:DNA-binding MarR family transcriptional regulator|nr:MarR family transcriptional regulator [Propionibacteriaceae bacterium]